MTAAKFSALVAGALLLLILFPVPAEAQENECTFGGLGLFFMDLKFPFSTNLVPAGVTVLSQPAPSANPACPGWHEALIRITIPDGCTRAKIWVQYHGVPFGWTLNLGGSPTNNGFGGDAGGNDGDNAELQVLDDDLSVYNAATVPEEVDRLAHQQLALTDGALNLTVGDQLVTWGQPLTVLDSEGLGRLFAIPSTGDGNAVYLGVNRVIANNIRNGCGVSRVMVSFQ